jgi:parallel beta-helix repeat protein
MKTHVQALRTALFCIFAIPLSSIIAQTNYLDPPGAPGSDEARMRTLNEVEPRQVIAVLPYAITNPGSYTVVKPLAGSSGIGGITISSSYVRLDLNGFPLTGTSNSLDGIKVTVQSDNITIRNGVLNNWGGFGINATNTKNLVLSDLKVYQNGCGGLYGGGLSLVERCGSYGNGAMAPTNDPPWTDGIQVGPYSIISECISSRNVGAGIHTYDYTKITGCMATESQQANGIWAENYCTIRDCTVSRNGGAGIHVRNNCRVEDNTSGDNHGSLAVPTKPSVPGVMIEGTNNVVENNSVIGNDQGIQAMGMGNLVIRNMASKNNNPPNSDYLPGSGNYFGTILSPQVGMSISNANPWANFQFQ